MKKEVALSSANRNCFKNLSPLYIAIDVTLLSWLILSFYLILSLFCLQVLVANSSLLCLSLCLSHPFSLFLSPSLSLYTVSLDLPLCLCLFFFLFFLPVPSTCVLSSIFVLFLIHSLPFSPCLISQCLAGVLSSLQSECMNVSWQSPCIHAQLGASVCVHSCTYELVLAQNEWTNLLCWYFFLIWIEFTLVPTASKK